MAKSHSRRHRQRNQLLPQNPRFTPTRFESFAGDQGPSNSPSLETHAVLRGNPLSRLRSFIGDFSLFANSTPPQGLSRAAIAGALKWKSRTFQKPAGAAYGHPALFFGRMVQRQDKAPIFQNNPNWNLFSRQASSPSPLASSNGARRASPRSKTRTARSNVGMAIGSPANPSPALAISSNRGWGATALLMSPSSSIPSFKNSRPSPTASPFHLKRAEPSNFFNTKTDLG